MNLMKNTDFAVVTPLANEEDGFLEFINIFKGVLDKIGAGKVYMVVDNVSKDNTLNLCRELEKEDERFVTVWSPQNRNVVDAYLNGYRAALEGSHEFIIEMDAGLSHDPRALPMFLRVLNEGNECAFGSRFVNGGSIWKSNWRRTVLSRGGTILSNILLGTSMKDMTSGYQGFHKSVAQEFLDYGLKSKAHFYQTEIRYLLRKKRFIEVPIHYRAPSPSVSKKAIINSFKVLFLYVRKRILFKSIIIE